MFRRNTTVTLAAVSALVAPVSAAEESEYAGFSCGFTSTNDPTGVVNQDPNVQFGEMNCGPWLAYELFEEPSSTPPTVDDNPELTSITIHGWIQVNNVHSAHYPIPSAHCDFTSWLIDGVAAGACLIWYFASPTDNVYLCTRVVMTNSDGTVTTVDFDADDNPANGIQCSLAAGG